MYLLIFMRSIFSIRNYSTNKKADATQAMCLTSYSQNWVSSSSGDNSWKPIISPIVLRRSSLSHFRLMCQTVSVIIQKRPNLQKSKWQNNSRRENSQKVQELVQIHGTLVTIPALWFSLSLIRKILFPHSSPFLPESKVCIFKKEHYWRYNSYTFQYLETSFVYLRS